MKIFIRDNRNPSRNFKLELPNAKVNKIFSLFRSTTKAFLIIYLLFYYLIRNLNLTRLKYLKRGLLL